VPATIRAIAALGAMLLCTCLPTAAQARQSVQLRATLSPEILGHDTALGFDLRIRAPHGLSGLGLDTCVQKSLEARGLSACPPNSIMGSGAAAVEIPVGPTIVRETTKLTVVRAPVSHGRFALIFYADGSSPVQAQLALPAFLLSASSPFGGKVDIHLPLVPSLPEGADVALVHLHATIGPEHLTYYERVNGRTIAFHPRGIRLPKSCPAGGFPFAATFAFSDGTHRTARTSTPCPP